MYTSEQIEQATVTQLREIAKELKLKNYTRINKEALKERLLEVLNQATEETYELETPKVFFDRVSVLTDIEQVKVACEQLIEALGTEHLKPKSKANKLAGYRKLFKELTPTTETIHLFFDYKPSEDKPAIKRHVFDKFTGLADMDWATSSDPTSEKPQVTDAISEALEEENKVFSLDRYIDAVTKLLNSSDCWEMGVGLMAVSGRRPSEIVMFGEFAQPDSVPTYITNPAYAVHVRGFAKKRGKNPDSVVPSLIPCDEFLEVFKNFRNHADLKPYRESFQNLQSIGYDKSDSWNRIEDSIGGKLRSVTDTYFDFLPRIDDGQNRKNILLRACATKIITLRDRPKVTSKARLTYAGIIAGHIIPEFKPDGSIKFDGKVNSSTLNYDDYDPDTLNIPLLNNVVKTQIKDSEEMAKIAHLEAKISELNSELEAKNQLIEELQARLSSNKKAPSEPLGELSMIEPSRLFKVRGKGTPKEKLNRAFQAIKDYNNDNPESRVILTNGLLRQLTGCNGQDVSPWMSEHNDEIVSHFSNFQEMLKSDGSLNMFYNRTRHRNEIEGIVENIKNKYLLKDVSV